jgi:phosphoadenosine phosphosulfate reductase
MSVVPLSLADDLSLRWGALDGRELLEVMIREVFPGRIAVTSSFGAEAAVLLDLVAQVEPATPVLFVDTDALFDETVAYRETLVRRLGLTDVRIARPSLADLAASAELWASDPDACCRLRKVLPFERVTRGFAALIDGRKGFHGAGRARLPVISGGVGGVVKISPLARWDEAEVEARFAARNLPLHPLWSQGYRSIGCWPCTRPVQPGEPARAGRWAGAAKTECGIHTFAGGDGI